MTDSDREHSPPLPPIEGKSDDDSNNTKPLNPHTALVLALIPGLFGFCGLGQMYKRSWGWGIGILILGWFLAFATSISYVQEYGPGVLWFFIPVTKWSMVLHPESPVMVRYGLGFIIGYSLPYILVWLLSSYSAYTGQEFTKAGKKA